jgi:hypothetical protein
VVSITDCVQGVTKSCISGIHDRESREHIGKREVSEVKGFRKRILKLREVKNRMSFTEEQSSGDQPSLESGWREARVPEVYRKAEGIAD